MGHKTTNYQMIYRFATKAASAIFFCRLKRRLIANNFDDPLIISGISVSLIWWFQFLTCQDLLIFFSFMTVNEDYLAFVLIAGQRKRFKDYICLCISCANHSLSVGYTCHFIFHMQPVKLSLHPEMKPRFLTSAEQDLQARTSLQHYSTAFYCHFVTQSTLMKKGSFLVIFDYISLNYAASVNHNKSSKSQKSRVT